MAATIAHAALTGCPDVLADKSGVEMQALPTCWHHSRGNYSSLRGNGSSPEEGDHLGVHVGTDGLVPVSPFGTRRSAIGLNAVRLLRPVRPLDERAGVDPDVVTGYVLGVV